jgi:(2Fe-2S) ferredoxin/SAM-dependent methyltransferase
MREWLTKNLEALMRPFRYHVLACNQQKADNVPCCAAAGANIVLNALREQITKLGLADEILISTTGCLGACEHGPVMIVYPDGVWYGALKPADAAEIAASHLRDGKPVERLMLSDEARLHESILEHRRQYKAMVEAKERAGILPENIELHSILSGFMSSRALLSALELDLFTAIGEGATAAEIAAKIHTDPRATEMLLNVIVSLGLMTKREGRFHNTPLTTRFLDAASPDCAVPGLMHTVHLWRPWSTLTECVRTGTKVAAAPADEAEPGDIRAFIAAMDRNARDRATQIVRAVGGSFQRLLDLGGGSAAYSIAFAQAHTELRAEVLDRAMVAPLTEDYIRRAGLEARIQARAGDMLTSDLGTGHDLVLISQIAHMFSAEENRRLLRRIAESLAPGGTLVIQDFILDADKTTPAFGALFALNMLVNTQGGSSYSEQEYSEWLREAGFRKCKRVRLPGPANLMVAVK